MYASLHHSHLAGPQKDCLGRAVREHRVVWKFLGILILFDEGTVLSAADSRLDSPGCNGDNRR